MQVTETLAEGLKRGLSITVPAGDLAGRLDKRLADLKDTVRINGFRPGKVPTAHLKRLVGAQEMAKIVDAVIGEAIRDVVEGRNERPALNPDVALADGWVMRKKPVAAALALRAAFSASVAALPPMVKFSPISTCGVPLHWLTLPCASKLTFSSPTTWAYSHACTTHTGLPSLSVSWVG